MNRRGLFIPQTPERYTYDADGNLTGDGQWSYAWDGENHLQKMERTALAPGGLLGSYYNHTTATIWTGPADLTRVEAVNFDWGTASPGPAIGVDHFNVLWTGQIEAPVTGDYLFESESDDGAEVWVNGVEIVANWGQREGNSIAQGTVSLVAGQKYDFKVYYLNVDGPAVMKLRWRKPGDSVATIIPAERLYHPVTALPQVKLEFTYDGQGRRVSKKVSNWDGGAWTLASSTLFLYDGWNLIAELNAMNANAVSRTYVWGLDLSGSRQGAGGVGGLLFSSTQTPNPGTYASAFDGNGNVIGLVDMATGAKSATYEYSAFGETLIADGVAAEAMPFRFSTKYQDAETGLIYYGLRYMRDGRWLSRDGLQEQGGVNLYGFIGNDSINDADFLGQRSIYTDAAGSFDPKKPTRSAYGSLAYNRQEITLKVCCSGQTEKLADEIYARMKEFKEFDEGNIASVTVSRRGYALFFPNSAFELLGSASLGHLHVTVSLSYNDSARLIGARTTGSHFLTGTRNWGVRSSNDGTIRIFTYAYERFSSPQFALGDYFLGKLPFVRADFHSQARATWNRYLTNIANYAESQAEICEKSGIRFEESSSSSNDNPTLRD